MNAIFEFALGLHSYPLGVDKLGRDLLSCIIYGARISLAVAVIGPTISMIIGITVGVTAGYIGGQVDNVLMRLVNMMYAFPKILPIILMMAVFRTSFQSQPPDSIGYVLKHFGVPTELVLYPREPHGFQERAHQIDPHQPIGASVDHYLFG